MRLAVAGIVLIFASAAAAFGPGNNKYNVLYFVADDLRPEIAGAGYPHTTSPNPILFFIFLPSLSLPLWLLFFLLQRTACPHSSHAQPRTHPPIWCAHSILCSPRFNPCMPVAPCRRYFVYAHAATATSVRHNYTVATQPTNPPYQRVHERYNQKVMHTPNIDKLASSGTVFRKAYCQQAVCGPSRNSFMTGRRPHHTNVDATGTGDDFRKVGIDASGKNGSEWITMPEHFKQHGYATLGGGKT